MSNAVSVDEITVIHTVEIFIHKKATKFASL